MSRACPHGGSRSWCESCLNEDLQAAHRAGREHAEMLALLRTREWTPVGRMCLSCYGYEKDGHLSGCRMFALLKRLGE